jgi:hypothetical protein
MSETLTLTVPADARYRVLGPEVAGKFAELVGGTPADGKALADAVSAALADVVDGSEDGSRVDLTFQTETGGVDVTIRCASRSSVVKHPLPVKR